MIEPSASAWCYYRNLVQTVYREARHIGAPGDHAAHLHVDDASLGRELANLNKWRQKLKGLDVFRTIQHATSTEQVRRPYEEMTV